ncbi:Trm112 family protein [Planctomycetota bacterium]
MIKQELLDILVCPICKGKLELRAELLICKTDKLMYPIRDDIPVMLPEEALPLEETDKAAE